MDRCCSSWCVGAAAALGARLGRAAPGAGLAGRAAVGGWPWPGTRCCAVTVSARAGGVGGDLRGLALDAARNAVPRLLTALIPVEAAARHRARPGRARLARRLRRGRARRPGPPAGAGPAAADAALRRRAGPGRAERRAWSVWQPLVFAAVAAFGLVAGGATSGRPVGCPASARPRTGGAAAAHRVRARRRPRRRARHRRRGRPAGRPGGAAQRRPTRAATSRRRTWTCSTRTR